MYKNDILKRDCVQNCVIFLKLLANYAIFFKKILIYMGNLIIL
jgi:hypothetical protein